MSTVNLYNVKPDQVKMLWPCIARVYSTRMRLSYASALSLPTPTCGQPDSLNSLSRTDVFSVQPFNIRIFLIVS